MEMHRQTENTENDGASIEPELGWGGGAKRGGKDIRRGRHDQRVHS